MVHRMVPAERQVRKTIHVMLQFVGLVLGIFGASVAFKFHRESQIPDMCHLALVVGHGHYLLIRIAAVVWLSLFLVSKSTRTNKNNGSSPHATAGLAIFLLTICTADSGFVQKGANPGAETHLVNFTGLFILLFGMAICLSTAPPGMLTI